MTDRQVPLSVYNTATNTAPSVNSTLALSIDQEKGPHQNSEDQVDNGDLPPEKQDAVADATPAPGPPPDGGLKAWSTVLGAFCGLFVSFGWINCELT